MIVSKGNELIVEQSNEAMRAWRKCSKFLVGIGGCYLFGILALGLKANIPTTTMLLYLMPLLLVSWCFLYGIRKIIKENPDIENGRRAVLCWFFMGITTCLVEFSFYAEIAYDAAKSHNLIKEPTNIIPPASFKKFLDVANALNPQTYSATPVPQGVSIKNCVNPSKRIQGII